MWTGPTLSKSTDSPLVGRLSTQALQLHLCAALASARSGRAGFVPTEFLAGIEEDIRLAVSELTLTGRWRYDAEGFRIPVGELRVVVATLREVLSDWID